MTVISTETNTLNIIHLPNSDEFPHRKVREDSFMEQIKIQGIKSFKVWNGIYDPVDTISAISRSHKLVVRHAKENELSRVIIAEDDVLFTKEGAWDYFLKSIPTECDMFLGHVYDGLWHPNGKLRGQFSSMSLYCVNSKFYDYFLSVPENKHIDLVMNNSWRHDIRVCLPMVCRQMSGWSDNMKKNVDYSYKEKSGNMF